MDLVYRFSTVDVVETANLQDAVVAFEASWISQFWYPDALQADKAFQVGDFRKYADEIGISIREVPPGRHSKNPIESKHRVIRTIFLRLKASAGSDHNAKLSAYKAVSISNDLYGNETLSSFEIAKGFTKPTIDHPKNNTIPKEIYEAQENLQGLRKLVLILKSKSVK